MLDGTFFLYQIVRDAGLIQMRPEQKSRLTIRILEAVPDLWQTNAEALEVVRVMVPTVASLPEFPMLPKILP